MIVIIIAIVLFIISITYYPKSTFDQSKWIENEDKRYRMSNDLIKKEILIGLSEEEVIDLLGNSFYRSGKDQISYYIGFVPDLFSIDPDIIEINFKNNRVVSVYQRKT